MLRLIALAAVVLAGVVAEAQAPVAPAGAAARAARAAERIQALQREADRLAADARGVLAELRRLEIDREIRRQELTVANAALAEASARLDEATARAEALAAERVAETPGLETRLVELYKRGRGGYARLLLGARDVRDWGRTTRGVAAMARLDRLRVEAHRRLVEAERAAVAVLAEARAEASAAQATAATAARELAAAVAARNRRLEDIDRRRDLTAQYVGELEAARRALQATVSTLGSGGAPSAPVALPLPPFRGALDWPVSGPVSARFGRAPSNRFGTAIVRNGIEIETPEDTAVRAVHEGTVAFAAPFTGYGKLVIVDHGDEHYSLYGHLSDATLEVGAPVERGTVVGRSGAGPSGEPGVYFELRIDGRPVDPLQWLRSSP
ncbi:MAG: murein hydrolase activator EnvC family protein [Vicinamibacteria bacterium]